MNHGLMSAIQSEEARKRRAEMSEDMKMAIAFAKLELTELEAGIRDIASCPGIITLARAAKVAV
jgi:hypothetical protein